MEESEEEKEIECPQNAKFLQLPPLPQFPQATQPTQSAQPTHPAQPTQSTQPTYPQPKAPEGPAVREEPFGTQNNHPEQDCASVNMESLRRELAFITDARLDYIVKLLTLKLFTKGELKNCSIYGKRSAKSTNVRAPLDNKQFQLLTKLVQEKLPNSL